MTYDLIHHSGADPAFAAAKFANGLNITAAMIVGSYSDAGYENPCTALPFTVEGWFQLASGAPNWQPWFQAGSVGAGGSGSLAFEQSAGVTTLKAVGVYGDEVAGSCGADIRGDGLWHHCAWVLTSTTVSLYFDGNRVATGTRTGTIPAHIIIQGGSYRGVIDDVRVSTIARYTGTTYTVPTARATRDANTTAIWRFDGSILNDPSATPTGPTADAGPDQSVATGATVTLTAAGSSGTGTLTYAWIQTGGPAVTLSSSTAASPTFTAPASASTLTFQVTVTDTVGSATDSVQIAVTAPATPPDITTTTLPGMTQGTAYSQTLTATGSTPITWSTTAGAWPAGVSMSSAGVVSGTPTASGTGSVTVQATNTGGSDTQVLSWSVNSPGSISHNDGNIFYQPYSWRTDNASYHRSLDQGSTLRVRLEGVTSITINATGSAAAYRVNQRSYVPFTGSVSVADLDASRTTHDLEIIAQDGSWQFSGLTVNSGGHTLPVRTSDMWGLAFGDSITRGAYAGAVDTAYQASYVWSMARALGAEIGIVAENSRTYDGANTPGFAFADAWQIQVPGTTVPIDFTRPPDFITLMVHAFAGQTSRIASTVADILDTLPTTKVFAIRHVAVESTRLAGTNEAAPIFASISHPRFHYIDTTGWLRDVDDLPDSIHPTRDAQWLHLGPRLANAIRPLLYEPTVTFVPAASWPPAADPDPLHFYARVT